MADTPPVTLREITGDTVRSIVGLEVAEHQRAMVATNGLSISQAYFEPKGWFRGVYAGDEPVGFVMVHEDPDESEYFLWRFMIDHRHQGNGYGRRALELVIERVRTLPNATRLLTSYVPGPGSPGDFYHLLGFVDTGDEDHGELLTALDLEG
ncbi:GNAT family N-acetyltransferase [bacterium]|nr:GNAT family N-acetyltransferase [bacterium]